MDLVRLTARGAKGFALFGDRGLDVSLDTLPEGLVAVVGRNGQGKTTFFEAVPAALYGEWPSRPGAFVDAFDGRSAFLDVVLALDRGRYRARVNVDQVARATDALLELTTPDGTVTRLNDGKVLTFRAAVKHHLPTLRVLLASAFACQKRTGSFARLDRAGRRELFAELLGLRHLETYADTSRRAGLVLDKRLTRLRALLDHLRPLTTDALAERHHQDGNRLATLVCEAQLAERAAARDQADASSTLDGLRQRAEQYAAASQALRDAEREWQSCQQTLTDFQRRVDEATAAGHRETALVDDAERTGLAHGEAAKARLETAAQLATWLNDQLADLTDQASTKTADRRRRIAANQQLLDQAPAIRAAAATVDAQTAALDAARRRVEDTRAAHQQAADREGQGRYAELHRGMLDRQAGLLGSVPCGGAGAFAACQFLQDAEAARIALLTRPPVDLASLSAAVTAAHTAHQDAIGQQRTILSALDTARPLAGRLADLNAAEGRVTDYEQEIEAIEAEATTARRAAHAEADRRAQAVSEARYLASAAIDKAKTDAAAKRTAISDRLVQTLLDLRAQAQTAADRSHHVQAQLTAQAAIVEAELPAAAAAREAETTLAAATAALAEARATAARLDAEAAAFRRERDAFQIQLDQRTRYETVAGALEQDVIEWQALARIFGKEGLQTLEIDAAGPGVSALANDLLETCSGGRFSVELITQQATTDGKDSKEIFGVSVYDHRDGGEAKDLGLLSGGEEVIVEEALRSAIALHLNQRNQLPIRTCWRDETIGALDPETAPQYVAMLRRLQQRGGFRRVYFITHNLAAAALADVQLRFEDGTVTVALPPFAESHVD
jgi:exonuclease SbcC